MQVYDATVPCFSNMLKALHAMLEKAERSALDLGHDPQDLLQARLAPDMHPLALQVKFVCTQALESVQRLTHSSLPAIATPTDMATAKALIDTTVAALNQADADAINASAECRIAIELYGGLAFDMTGQEYAVNWAIPQFYFHMVTAYDILRHNGVDLSKADYVAHMFAYARKPV
ncbi:hypothetical protein CCOS865_04027 [Pseudomonas reidholzensis]|uniref:DUF1993 domain-containing protein n=1 Tax=Pseudomonas reidholzensis TaxID=1785162 RepID=A0A383RXD2_9PSED|nr:DUF1993 domain-containing protein [Pseudomonas reidholzensis]SYX91747.1 hypothetical protein CCOS865_04027 [Pseudomonas reidholzensis]